MCLQLNSIDEAEFKSLAENQELNATFPDYGSYLKKLLNNCLLNKEMYSASLYVTKDEAAALEFVQNIRYKQISLLTIGFVLSDFSLVTKCINFKHNLVAKKFALIEKKLVKMDAIINEKNPSLLVQIQKVNTQPVKAKFVNKKKFK